MVLNLKKRKAKGIIARVISIEILDSAISVPSLISQSGISIGHIVPTA
jgi:hypothetical protein